MLKFKNIPYYLQLMRVEKPIGSYLLMWPTLWGIWVASNGQPSAKILIIFMLGVFIMRSAGCVINDIADRDIDKFVERTKDRPLTSGKVTTKEAATLLLLLVVIAGILALFLSGKTMLLAIPALFIAMTYPFMKRFHSLPQAHLGAAFAFGIPMAFMEIQGSLPLSAYLLFFSSIIWTLVYDTQYAMSDREDDKSINIKSSALLFESWLGAKDYYIIIGLQGTMIALLLIIGYTESLSIYFQISILIVIMMFYSQIMMIKNHDRQRCFQAFLQNNWVGLTIFAGLFLNYLP